MKTNIVCLLSFFIALNVHAQSLIPGKCRALALPDTILKNFPTKAENMTRLDSALLEIIKAADQSCSVNQLSEIVVFASNHCAKSENISLELSGWLKENHPVYKDKSPTEVNQFRSFLIYSLCKFPPTENLYTYIKNELQFSNHILNIASAAHTSKIFPSNAKEIVQLLNPYLESSIQDTWVDITTCDLNYPLLCPTKARYEIIKSLKYFGVEAFPSVKFLQKIMEAETKKQVDQDTILIYLSNQTVKSILEDTPICCRKEAPAGTESRKIAEIIPIKNRKKIDASDMTLLDQDGNTLTFNKLSGKPFVLTFFYTSCTNPLKCASTVDRLSKLQKIITEQQTDKKVGVYAITYDPNLDSPSILKSYGKVYGMSFSKNAKFLAPQNDSEQDFFNQLDLRVNYGYGSVNQHGIQLFIFDKKGRIAMVYDNDVWEPNDVYRNLMLLAKWF